MKNVNILEIFPTAKQFGKWVTVERETIVEQDLSGIDLSLVQFTKCEFFDCNFNDSVIRSFTSCKSYECQFKNATFCGNATESKFVSCDMIGATYAVKSIMNDAHFIDCDMRNSTIGGCWIDTVIDSSDPKSMENSTVGELYKLWSVESNQLQLASYILEPIHIDSCTYPFNLIATLPFTVNMFMDIIQIGCKKYTREEWENFTDEQITSMSDGALNWWNENKTLLFSLHDQYLSGINK